MEQSDRISLLHDFLCCGQNIDYWLYDSDRKLETTTSQAVNVLNPIFRHSGCLDYAFDTDTDQPLILSNPSGMTWIAIRQMQDGQVLRLHVLGPCMAYALSPYTLDEIRSLLRQSQAPDSYKERLLDTLENGIPTIQGNLLSNYAFMLDYAVSGRHRENIEIHYQNFQLQTSELPFPQDERYRKDRMYVYRGERMLLNAVRNGDIGILGAKQPPTDVANVQPYVPEPLGQLQIAYTILTSLCVRAAIEGGLSPEKAYSTGDNYIKKLFRARSITECRALRQQMYAELVNAVHNVLTEHSTSKVVKSCCDYIETHVEEDLNLKLLADRLGYTKYYLSRRFKEDAHCSVNTYIQIARVERAKVLLACSDLSVMQIAEKLQFSSSSHFSTVFKRLTGCAPSQFREEKQSL